MSCLLRKWEGRWWNLGGKETFHKGVFVGLQHDIIIMYLGAYIYIFFFNQRSFTQSFDPVGQAPFLPVTPSRFLLSQNCSPQARGPWHEVTLCHWQEPGLICSLLTRRAGYVDLWAERGGVWSCAAAGGLYFVLCYTEFRILRWRALASSQLGVIACLPLHGAQWKCPHPVVWLSDTETIWESWFDYPS